MTVKRLRFELEASDASDFSDSDSDRSDTSVASWIKNIERTSSGNLAPSAAAEGAAAKKAAEEKVAEEEAIRKVLEDLSARKAISL